MALNDVRQIAGAIEGIERGLNSVRRLMVDVLDRMSVFDEAQQDAHCDLDYLVESLAGIEAECEGLRTRLRERADADAETQPA